MQGRFLEGKTALVTGAGRGIGRATAILLAAAGARVVLTARSAGQIDAVAAEIENLGGEALAIPSDVASEPLLGVLFDAAGPVDILINNAGIIAPISPVADVDPEAWWEDIRINLYGVFLPTRYAVPGMLDRGWGRIVNVSSGAARGHTSGWSAYSSAKAGVEAFTTVLAHEVGDQGIRVNAVRPGVVDTRMQVEIRNAPVENFGQENLERFRGYKERGSLRNPEDPARLILWLVSPEAGDINGQVLSVDEPELAERLGIPMRPR